MKMLNEHYTPYSENRINMVIGLLQEYNIDINDENALNMLIEEAQIAQTQSDYFEPLKKPLKTLYAVIAAVLTYFMSNVNIPLAYDNALSTIMLIIALILLIFALFMAFTPIIKEILYKDYNKYNELISDLRQIKIFYMHKSE